ncbi:M1 family aminopeptidase [Zhouia sp. PK063]|uniref:M1 family aminopeptidase n=1 Tax=Zhouia sp. PK063 TaxID=3373602 RepID=UPI00379CBE9F
MLSHLIFFEWKFYTRKISFYILLLAFFGFGILVGTSAGIVFPNIKYNSPYAINFILGLFSLLSLFPIVIIASQSLVREKETQFEQLLYTTSIATKNYLISRFLLLFGIASICYLLFITGYMAGHLTSITSDGNWETFHFYYYINSFVILILPNIFLCTAIVSSIAWFSKSKMAIYVSGLGIYVLYMVGSIFSNSPLLAGASPVSDEAMNLSAKLDPFGMAAFFEQTYYWSALQKNTFVLKLTGNLLLNRVGVLVLACILLGILYKYYTFKVHYKASKKLKTVGQNHSSLPHQYHMVISTPKGTLYFGSTICSFIKIDLKYTLKSIPFLLFILITLFVVGMEMYGAIEGGIRLPQYFVTTTLMVNTILATTPLLLVIITLFYGSELVWKSKSVLFSPIENSTPFSYTALFIAKFVVLLMLTIILISSCITLGILFQFWYGFPILQWKTYVSLYYYLGWPTALCSLLAIALQYLFKNNKYIALSLAALFLMLTNTSMGKLLGFRNPLLRFANFFPAIVSEMNGFGYVRKAFLITMIYSSSFALLLAFIVIYFKPQTTFKLPRKLIGLWIIPIAMMLFTGLQLVQQKENISEKEQLDWQQHYEEVYKSYKNIPQPTITNVKTFIDLYPEKNSYKVKGTYTLVNNTSTEISTILIGISRDVKLDTITSSKFILKQKDTTYGQYLMKTKHTMAPMDSITMDFNFEYTISPLKGHRSFNAIVKNGAFMRISNYYPVIGYNMDNEIQDSLARAKRHMPLKDMLTDVHAPIPNPYPYQFINFDATISTSKNQTAVSVGELTHTYTTDDRNYFHYQVNQIPFRFAVSSAHYVLKKVPYHQITIEVLYDPNHEQNIDRLIKGIQHTLNYCEANFGKYPYTVIRFAEISSFTRGFAATAYPATVFINEKQLYLNLEKGEGHDVINELAGHELSHEWWGNAQLYPDYRQGSGVLTETLAQYTQLMLYKNEYGISKMLDMVKFYKNMYNSEKAFSGEEALYNSDPNNANVIYNKGLVNMYDLYKVMGEKQINLALKSVLQHHAYPLPPATTLDLIKELKQKTSPKNYSKIDTIFKQ